MAGESTKTVYVTPEAALAFAHRLLLAHDIPDADANIIAECLVRADLRGTDTHGIIRLPGYLDRVRRRLINPQPQIEVTQVAPVAASVDGKDGFGYVVGTRAMQEAITMARRFGIAIAGARHSTHFGIAASYVLQAIRSDLIGMVFTNASPTMPPWGGRRPMFGTNPLALGAPGGKLGPFLLDMAVSVAARGKIHKALRQGASIPEGYALDAEGRPTTDPASALKGVVLPLGGYKGSGLAMMIDIFGGVLTGAAYGGDVRDQYKDFEHPQNVGHLFLAMRPDLFVSLEEYKNRMDTLIQRVHDCPAAEGFSEVFIAGEIESRQEAIRRQRGIPYTASDVAALHSEAARAGVPGLEVSDVAN